MHSPGLPKVTLIDEPEVSLHPEMLRLLADLMREASERTQLIVATHSDRLVGFLNPDELVVCDHDEKGNMTTKRADELDLAAWMEDYTLDNFGAWAGSEAGLDRPYRHSGRRCDRSGVEKTLAVLSDVPTRGQDAETGFSA